MATAADLLFRAATERDIPALVELVESAYRGDASRVGWTTEADLLDGQRTDAQSLAESLARPDTRMLLASRAGSDELLACCTVERREGGAYFGMFSVRPTQQGGGVGRAVLAEAERFAREEWGAGELEMTVIVQRADLIAWYERRGFTRTGELSPFPYGDERFGVPKRPDLAFEKLVKAL
ncbi:GNAT family N-acetyltransferase [Kitasatospora kifunensis]|uniref:Ribosomal protein S18 acetylase RimI-like enzyme n=1 Tax=Kitasatospora kifunensis TaxID=58351 RepID=A0A7W7QX27_KITKI|nr:GNAT family N-acetyltransferase [Kitasatospora kifunensis]MBB4921396.1 ribosomal protein S18 acetylase RimI-like enzyme [Kitasatospora kifunensis]